MENKEIILKDSQERVNRGASSSDLIGYLHDQGQPITESIKIIKQVYALSLGEAKSLVTAHSIWAATVRSSDLLHQELEELTKHEK